MDSTDKSVEPKTGRAPAGTYVLITPAYNESGFIAPTIESVLAQTIKPLRWMIVDDGSTDDTAAVVQRYVGQGGFIEYCRRERRAGESYYGSNVYAILQGYERLRGLAFDYVAILDADITLCRDYYEEVFRRFDANPELGIATGTYLEKDGQGGMKEADIDRRHTPKALQVFRRSCYERIGGYLPCRYGGEDTCAEIMARMHGWQTWSFPEVRTIHQRPVGTGDGRSILRARFRLGLTDYTVATHPVFMLAKCLRRCVKEKPRVISGAVRWTGFLYGYTARVPRQLPVPAVRYVRREQMRRLLRCLGLGRALWRPGAPLPSGPVSQPQEEA
jgi:biofilm PGA synthesis N-glycosyltransferase PgaC